MRHPLRVFIVHGNVHETKKSPDPVWAELPLQGGDKGRDFRNRHTGLSVYLEANQTFDHGTPSSTLVTRAMPLQMNFWMRRPFIRVSGE
jgi:hypothetical protein